MRTAADTTVEESAVRLTLSPSRASDFMTCPLLYRFRTIDRLPERPSPEATRGTVVHAVLERLYDLLHRVSRATHRRGTAEADLSFLTSRAPA